MEIGQQFGKLTVTGFGRNRFGQRTAACRCECGHDTATTQTRLTVGRSNSCGCLRQRSSPVNGIDRVDNGKGYTVENIVPCCQTCNYAKRGMILEEFRTWLAKLRTNLRLETAKVLATDSGIKASVTACHGESYH